MANTLFAPTTLARAINRLGFVQADPIRAPARAQDLILRHRVKNYRAGGLDKKYLTLDIEEDFFINHGFLPSAVHRLLHPRVVTSSRSAMVKRHGPALLEFIGKHGVVHPRDVAQHFKHGSTTNGWGGQSSVAALLLDGMHYRGTLRIAGRDKGIRLYALPKSKHPPRTGREIDEVLDQLVDVLMSQYAPVPANSIGTLLGRLRYGTPQWQPQLAAAIKRAKTRLQHSRIDGVDWYWPDNIKVGARHHAPDDNVRLLAPFDPIVWDRKRFELLWGWAYRFEAYTPAPKRKLGYYALPMLWREHIIGWANVAVQDGDMTTDLGYVAGRAPKDGVFKRALNEELGRLQHFLGVLA